ncbi:MAG: hypothetical protein HN368_13330 [Spirochaetales bacterium]|nr:hypothetical protein [Spirochaetales bacterium]
MTSIGLLLGLAPKLAADSGHGHDEEETGLVFTSLFNDKPYFSHIHGIGFLPEEATAIIAAHDGLWFYESGEWAHPNPTAHDFMAFAPVRDGFYASGHPDLTTQYPNPLGLVKVIDAGANLELVRFAGQLDFHNVAAAHDASSIYVYNDESVPEMSQGMHYSVDNGVTWQAVSANVGVGEPSSLSAHPTVAGTVALITGGSILLSTDFGGTFFTVDGIDDPSALVFHPDGKRLLIGDSGLHAYDLAARYVTSFSVSFTVDDAITHIAVNHADVDQIVVATESHAIYATLDAGGEWVTISSSDGTDEHVEEEEPCDCGSPD